MKKYALAPGIAPIARHPNAMKIQPIALPNPYLAAFLIMRVNPFQAAVQKFSLVSAT